MKLWAALLGLLNVVVAGLILTVGSPEEPVSAEREEPELEHRNLTVQRSADPAPEQAPEQEQADGDSRASNCLFLGPAAESGDLEEVRARLSDNETDVVTNAVNEDPLWWVYIPPADSLDAARGRLAALQERGIESFRVPDGEFENAISLGYFRGQENAERLHAEYQTRGIDAELERIPQTRDEYWLKVVLPTDTSASPVEAAAQASDLNAEERSCGWPDSSG